VGEVNSKPLMASVVVNNYNYGRFLADAIDSALAQTYAPLDVVVVDDGSTDESRDIIASYGDRIVPVLKENGGQGSALNAGFAASRGDIVVFLDSDDLLLPTAVERAVPCFDDPRVVKAYWQLWEVDADRKLLGDLIPRRSLPEGEVHEEVLRFGPSAIVETPTSGNAWSRRFLERVLPMPEREFRINSDCYLSTLAPIYGTVRTVAEPQSHYRVHGDNRYVLMTVGEKSKRHFDLYLQRCDLLARHCQLLDIAADPDSWKDGNWSFDYLEKVWITSEEIAQVVPKGHSFILLDDGKWGDGRAGTEAVSGRVSIPFLEHNGAYYGRPADDAAAIRELERVRAEQTPDFLVVVWLGFWWLEYYTGFAAHLRTSYRCVVENERIVIYDLTPRSEGEGRGDAKRG